MKKRIFKLDEKGQGLTEYIALLLLIAVVSFGVTKTLGNRVKSKIKEASDHINSDLSLSSGRSGGGGGSSLGDTAGNLAGQLAGSIANQAFGSLLGGGSN